MEFQFVCGKNAINLESNDDFISDKYSREIFVVIESSEKIKFFYVTRFFLEEINRLIFVLKTNEKQKLKSFDIISSDKDFSLSFSYNNSEILEGFLKIENDLLGISYSLNGKLEIDLFMFRKFLEEILS